MEIYWTQSYYAHNSRLSDKLQVKKYWHNFKFTFYSFLKSLCKLLFHPFYTELNSLCRSVGGGKERKNIKIYNIVEIAQLVSSGLICCLIAMRLWVRTFWQTEAFLLLEFACSPSVDVDVLQVPWFPPTNQRHTDCNKCLRPWSMVIRYDQGNIQ